MNAFYSFISIIVITCSNNLIFSEYQGEIHCISDTIRVTGRTDILNPTHYYNLRITSSYQPSITISSCGTEFNSKIFVYNTQDTTTSLASCFGDAHECTFCDDPSVFPRNQIVTWNNACIGSYYIQIKGKDSILDIGNYTITISNCNDSPSPLLENLLIEDTLSCGDSTSMNSMVYGTTWNNDQTQYYEVAIHDYQKSILLSNCNSGFDTKLFVYRYDCLSIFRSVYGHNII